MESIGPSHHHLHSDLMLQSQNRIFICDDSTTTIINERYLLNLAVTKARQVLNFEDVMHKG